VAVVVGDFKLEVGADRERVFVVDGVVGARLEAAQRQGVGLTVELLVRGEAGERGVRSVLVVPVLIVGDVVDELTRVVCDDEAAQVLVLE
jgi:hypothetical protein